MRMNIKKWIPWNWFRQEEAEEGVPVHRAPLDAGPPSAPLRADPIETLRREIDRLFGQFGRGLHAPWSLEGAAAGLRGPGHLLKPSVDIRETPHSYVVTLEIPGVEEGDVRVELDDRVLVVRGEKKHEQSYEEETYHWVERSYGTFQRLLSLPEDAREQDIEARFAQGVLTITIPRSQAARPEQRRVIDVKHA